MNDEALCPTSAFVWTYRNTKVPEKVSEQCYRRRTLTDEDWKYILNSVVINLRGHQTHYSDVLLVGKQQAIYNRSNTAHYTSMPPAPSNPNRRWPLTLLLEVGHLTCDLPWGQLIPITPWCQGGCAAHLIKWRGGWVSGVIITVGALQKECLIVKHAWHVSVSNAYDGIPLRHTPHPQREVVPHAVGLASSDQNEA